MEFLMNRFEALGIDVCIDLGGGDIGMAEHFLDDAQRSAVLQQMAGKRVAQGVRRHVFHNARFLGVFLDDLPQALATERCFAV